MAELISWCTTTTDMCPLHVLQRPSCWIHTDQSKGDRKLGSDEDIIFCGQRRPDKQFVPTNVSAQSRKLIAEWRRTESVWDALHSNAAAEEKRIQLIEAIREDESIELTGHPQIPVASRAIVLERLMAQQEAAEQTTRNGTNHG